MTYLLGARSRAALAGVHPNLLRVVAHAIQITTQDFAVHEGLRSIEAQRENFARGVSKTMASKHLKQPDGFGHAVDLVPFVNDMLRWEWPPIYAVAEAMRAAAQYEGVRLRWGGSWDRCLNDIVSSPALAVREYQARHPGPDFLDGPHFELAAA